jgi:hypothetical protein
VSTNPHYKHSKVFQSLKNIRETIQGNLPTSQYLQIYDDFLEKAMVPILLKTRYFDSFLTRLIGWQEQNFRRKVSFKDRPEFPSLAVTFLLQISDEGRISAYKTLALDRGIRIQFIKAFLSHCKDYRRDCNLESVNDPNDLKQIMAALNRKIEHESNLEADSSLMAVIKESEFWLEKALDFKQQILEKYIRLCCNSAKRDYIHFFNCSEDLDDIIQTYLLAASRAIDKCDYRQGTLTNHIQNWFLTARTFISKKKEARSVKVDEPMQDFIEASRIDHVSSAEDETLDEETRNDLREILRIADPIGAARAFLGIEEALSEKEKEKLFELAPKKQEISGE